MDNAYQSFPYFVERVKQDSVDIDAAKLYVDSLTEEEREKVYDICVVASAVSLSFGPRNKAASTLAEYIGKHHKKHMEHYQLEGKEGLLLKHQGKIVFGEVIDGYRYINRGGLDDSPVLAVGFVAYCSYNEPRGNGDIYTPYFDKYYNDCFSVFGKKKQADIKLTRNRQRLETEFLKEHIEEEKQGFERSKELFSLLPEDETERCKKLFSGYMDYLNEKKIAVDNTDEELETTENLSSIFHNNKVLLQKFLHRIKGKSGARIVDEVFALADLKTIDEQEVKEPLRKELEDLGYNTTSKANWSKTYNNRSQHDKRIKDIQREYQSTLK